MLTNHQSAKMAAAFRSELAYDREIKHIAMTLILNDKHTAVQVF